MTRVSRPDGGESRDSVTVDGGRGLIRRAVRSVVRQRGDLAVYSLSFACMVLQCEDCLVTSIGLDLGWLDQFEHIRYLTSDQTCRFRLLQAFTRGRGVSHSHEKIPFHKKSKYSPHLYFWGRGE